MTERHVPLLHGRTLRLLELDRAALLDLIDCGPTSDLPTITRTATSDEQRATLRGRNTDADYTPTPTAPRGGSGGEPSDPTGNAIVARETRIQYVLNLATDLAATAALHADSLLLDPVDEHGDHLPPPQLPADVADDPVLARPEELGPDHGMSVLNEGRTTQRINIDPAAARHFVIATTAYVTAVVDAIADRWRTSGADAGTDLHDKVSAQHRAALRLHRATTGIYHDPTEPPAKGQCTDPLERGCTRILDAPDQDRGRTVCGPCRTAKVRLRKRLDSAS